MGYTNVALEDKIFEIYPEIREHGISTGIIYDEGKNSFVVKFQKDKHELTTYLDKKDADECMEGVKCVHLGVQIGEFIKNFETGE